MRRSVSAAGSAAPFLVCGLVLGLASPAEAYVRYRSAEGAVFSWPESCVMVTAYPGDFPTIAPNTAQAIAPMTSQEVENAVRGAAGAWSANPCTYLDIQVQMGDPAPGRVKPEDRRNQVLFRTKNWCLLRADLSCDPLDNNYPQEALALTTVSAVVSTGVIRDVDLEVNATPDPGGGPGGWADLVAHADLAAVAQTMNLHDLQNALTHEFGHLIGLDHTCHNPGTDAPLNHLGEPIPTCPTASADVQETTMFLSARPGDTHMRTLAPDDQLAVCDIYPAASDPMTCSPPPPIGGDDEGCNCATIGARSPGGIAAELIAFCLVAGLLVFARRRGSRASC